ncbi:pyruvate ferredoxin oxidoreductase [Candidatus Bathyarchaeota archaeon]|nr:pyruvate ferredoxin oxidoreductase [Candidatus Bathyarchaeota archaeon]RJS87647.1 MAG: pyruvate ferredoxin oxidoreductase [Candidatus Bathyarchaeota archaeon]
MSKILGLTGDGAVAYAVKQCNVDVVAAYPITPQTLIVEEFSEYVHNGEVHTEFVCVESEHSAMSACVGASLTGARVFTATASQGLALMHEILYIASSLRCPIVMGVVNRTLSAPINIHCDHSDMMGSRDCGWIQIYVENAQEAYDWVLQAFRIAEDPDVLLPVTVNLDAFILSHSLEGVKVLDDAEVEKFVSTRKPVLRVDPDKPITVGALCLTDFFFETKRQHVEAMNNSPKTISRVNNEFAELTGRRYDFIETFGMDDAEAAIICLGSTAGTAKAVAKSMRSKGKKVGVIKPWVYRPFPAEQIVKAIENLKALAVLDRACSIGAPYGPLCSDTIATLYREGIKLGVFNVIYGLGGRDMTPFDIETVFNETLEVAKTGVVKEPLKFVGVRE